MSITGDDHQVFVARISFFDKFVERNCICGLRANITDSCFKLIALPASYNAAAM